MAKDDYFVLVYKILAYLYTVLKEGRSPDAKMLQYDSTLLGVNEPYWAYIMENLQAQGYITGLTVVAAWGGARSISIWNDAKSRRTALPTCLKITCLPKQKRLLKDVKAMTPFI